MTSSLPHKLYSAGLIDSPKVELLPLTGGVSSDIYLVKSQPPFVAKQALEQLKVKAEWHADISRNLYEQRYLSYVSSFLPAAVPKVLYADHQAGFFTMEYLGENFDNWKQLLLDEKLDEAVIEKVVSTLATIHLHSHNDVQAQALFDSDSNFYQLRVEPYFLTLTEQYPELAEQITANCQRLTHCKEALVHGDFSPKNILISADRVIVLDCEVAWYGDPAFDVAFLMTHLLLKSRHLNKTLYLQAVVRVYELYQEKTQLEISSRLIELVPMLLLARSSGKSPAEYLSPSCRTDVARCAHSLIQTPPTSVAEMIQRWSQQ